MTEEKHGTRPFVLGLTGSLGMGKSTAARFFADEGVPVHDSDAVVQAFPGSTSGGKVDRAKLAAIVLNDPAALARLEAIVHPLVSESTDEFLADAKAKGAPVVVLDVPLLFEVGTNRRCDAVVVVSAPPEVQRQRVLERPGMTEEKLTAILAKQLPDAEKRRRADFIVDSSKDFDHARAQVRDILSAVAKITAR
jgi:dephospho-CoA kinase